MEERIRVPGGIASARDGDELDLDALDDVAGGLDRAWPADAGAIPMAEPGSRTAAGTVIRG